MLKVVLRYTDCLQDGKNVFAVLAAHNVEILKTRGYFPMHPRVTIRINDHDRLNKLLIDFHRVCSYEVRVLKVKDVKE